MKIELQDIIDNIQIRIEHLKGCIKTSDDELMRQSLIGAYNELEQFTIPNIKVKMEQEYEHSDKLINWSFEDERGREVQIISISGDWCMVTRSDLEQPYVLSKEFVMTIYNEYKNQ